MDIIAILFIKIPAQGLLLNMFYIQILSVQTVQKTKKELHLFLISRTFWKTFPGQPLADGISQSTVTYNGRRLKVEDKEIVVYCSTMIVDK